MRDESGQIQTRPLTETDRPWVTALLTEQCASPRIVSRGKLYEADQLPGFAAMIGETPVGLLTYRIDDDGCEIVTLHSVKEGMGVGSALIKVARDIAHSQDCNRLWLITTNDNTGALRFYQKQGFTLVAVYPNALEQARILKPEIPLIGNDGIPLRDEIELEILL